MEFACPGNEVAGRLAWVWDCIVEIVEPEWFILGLERNFQIIMFHKAVSILYLFTLQQWL